MRFGKIFVCFSKFHYNIQCVLVRFMYVCSKFHYHMQRFLVRFVFVFSKFHYNIQCFLVRFLLVFSKVSKGEKIRVQYNQVPHLVQDTNGKVTNSQLDTTNESQEVSPFPAGGYKAHKEQKHKRSTKEVPPWNGQ